MISLSLLTIAGNASEVRLAEPVREDFVALFGMRDLETQTLMLQGRDCERFCNGPLTGWVGAGWLAFQFLSQTVPEQNSRVLNFMSDPVKIELDTSNVNLPGFIADVE